MQWFRFSHAVTVVFSVKFVKAHNAWRTRAWKKHFVSSERRCSGEAPPNQTQASKTSTAPAWTLVIF